MLRFAIAMFLAASAAVSASGPVKLRVGPRVLEKRLVKRVDPVCPANTKCAGDVHLMITVNPEGRVEGVRALKGSLALVSAAEAAVRQWEYDPLKIQGRPAEVNGEIVLHFPK